MTDEDIRKLSETNAHAAAAGAILSRAIMFALRQQPAIDAAALQQDVAHALAHFDATAESPMTQSFLLGFAEMLRKDHAQQCPE